MSSSTTGSAMGQPSDYHYTTHNNQIVALYATDGEAQAAKAALLSNGFPASAIQVVSRDGVGGSGTASDVSIPGEGDSGLWGAVRSLFVPDEDRNSYTHAISHGHAMVVVTPTGDMDRAKLMHVLEGSNPVDFDAKLQEWQSTGYDYSQPHEHYAAASQAAGGAAPVGFASGTGGATTGSTATGGAMSGTAMPASNTGPIGGTMAGDTMAGEGEAVPAGSTPRSPGMASTARADMDRTDMNRADMDRVTTTAAEASTLDATGMEASSLPASGMNTAGMNTAAANPGVTGTGMTDTGSANTAGMNTVRSGTMGQDTTGTPQAASVSTGTAVTGREADDENTLKVVEERLRVGKREVAGGTTRIRSYIVERPVEEQVRLREERVTVDRHPVDRPATGADLAAFQERTIEARATSEEAVVSKEARVVEEIGLRKEATERTQTIRDTVRRTEVEIDDGTTPSGAPKPRP